MKKVIVFILILGFCLINVNTNVNAEEIYYTNVNNVGFSKEQYDFFSTIFYDGYQQYMTKEDFDYFPTDVMNKDLVETNYISYNDNSDGIQTIGSYFTDANRTLKISKISGTYAYITTVLTWTIDPTIKSYDVIGAYLDGVSLVGDVVTKMVNNSGSTSFDVSRGYDKGFGTSVKLSGSGISVTQMFKTTKGGTVYASYQHAKSTISAVNSKKFTLSKNGFGGVFNFTGVAKNIYDRMTGVSLAV